MEKLTQIKNELPRGFLTWIELRKSVGRNLCLCENGVFNYQDFEAKKEFYINIDFMKARCFDEIMKIEVTGKDFIEMKAMISITN